ncbi:MAG: response regulator [Cyanobacteria bacterium P01_A01_bin.84]
MSIQPVILTVSSNLRNLELLKQFLGREGYEVITASFLEEFDRAISQSNQIKLGLIDVAGFDRRIWEWCKQLRNQQISFLIISPHQNTLIQRQSLACGAINILVKPLVMKQLSALIKSFIED